MNISDLITQLTAIQAAHGDCEVLHHDDWTNFVVDRVTYEDGAPIRFANGGVDDAFQAPHVQLTGESVISDLKGGWEDLRDRQRA